MTSTTTFTPRPATFDGFVRREGTGLVDGAGRPLLLRGVGLGNWLLPEGYMWGFGPGAESPREIEALVARLAGQDYATTFWRRFRATFITERDVATIAASGFDHVRLPINARVVQDDDGEPVEEGYALIDQLLEWCREHRLWALLDLHGAPGGQTGTNIDDSPNGKPELFLDERYRNLTLRLWRDLATRYADETVVLGYDLLNEPLPDEWQHRHADDLAALYRDLTAEIRAVDTHHLIMYEGSHWATNWDVFTEVWDDNSALQFHKYWSPPDRPSIVRFLETRGRLGLPIYMGEGGENTLEWLYTAFRLYESEGIGWNFWPWKKVDTRTSPVSVPAPDGWGAVVASAGGEPALDADEARRVLDELLEAVAIEHAVWQPDVVAALLGERPAVVPVWGFGFRGEGESYKVGSPRPSDVVRSDEAVTLTFAADGEHPENPFAQTDGRPYDGAEVIVAELDAGDWLEFEVEWEPGEVEVVDGAGAPAPVTVTRGTRGLRVTAATATRVASLRRKDVR